MLEKVLLREAQAEAERLRAALLDAEQTIQDLEVRVEALEAELSALDELRQGAQQERPDLSELNSLAFWRQVLRALP